MGYFHREGNLYLLTTSVSSVILLLLFLWSESIWILILLIISAFTLLFSLQFFRYPSRPGIDSDPLVIVSPADGKVVANEILEDGKRQISIFMSPLNVHANWVPISGTIVRSDYIPGKYLVAWHPKSSSENERHEVVIKVHGNTTITVKQIAGAVARRVRCYLTENQQVNRGDELGFIKFGSRVDLIIPGEAKVLVAIEDRVTGNQSKIAELT